MLNYSKPGNGIRNVPSEAQLGFVADWANTLNGKGDLNDALRKLMQLTRADSIRLFRTPKNASDPRKVASCDAEAGRVFQAAGLNTLAEHILGDRFRTAIRGSVWTLTDAVAEIGYGGARFPRHLGDRNSLQEAVIVVLENAGWGTDHLELHYRGAPQRHDLDLLTIMARTLAHCWATRANGLVEAQCSRPQIRVIAADGQEKAPEVLDTSNPANLSRCEFRVCIMLKDGMRVKTMASELSVSEATVRSHLSSIYSKLGVSCQVELLHALSDPSQRQGASRPA